MFGIYSSLVDEGRGITQAKVGEHKFVELWVVFLLFTFEEVM